MVDASKERPRTRVDAIVDRMMDMIAAGLLKPGGRVASIRRAAADHAVSKNTMAEAYDRLVALGHLEGRPGSGYYVGVARPPSPRPRPHVAEALDLVSLLREQLDQRYEVRPGDGRPPSSWMEGSELGAQFGGVKLPRGVGIEYGYGSSWGYLPLRERICLSLAERSIRCLPEQVLLTQGANHALDLITRHLIEPGDVVFVDDPGYYPLFGKLRLAKALVVGIRRTADGPDLDDLGAKLAYLKPKLFFTQSLAHNPTGGSLSPSVAYGVLQAAGRHGFHLVEDDAFADILPPSSPRLAALDGLDRVLYVGTFSKTLSASLRVGVPARNDERLDAQSGLVFDAR
jgi:DNA-binding transcriptional MocR family regulator